MGRPLNNWRGSCRGPLLWKEVRRVDISINAQRSVPVRHPSVTASLSKKKEEKKKQRIKTRDYSLALCFPFVAPLLLSSHAKGSSHSAVLYLFAKEASVLLLPKPYKLTLEIKKKNVTLRVCFSPSNHCAYGCSQKKGVNSWCIESVRVLQTRCKILEIVLCLFFFLSISLGTHNCNRSRGPRRLITFFSDQCEAPSLSIFLWNYALLC